jgi:hypothetical protein
LQVEDFVLYAVVVQRMELQNKQQSQGWFPLRRTNCTKLWIYERLWWQ